MTLKINQITNLKTAKKIEVRFLLMCDFLKRVQSNAQEENEFAKSAES